MPLWKVKSHMSDRDHSDLVRCTKRPKETRFTGVLEERNKEQGGDQRHLRTRANKN